jgi:hypothetical protein
VFFVSSIPIIVRKSPQAGSIGSKTVAHSELHPAVGKPATQLADSSLQQAVRTRSE